MRCPPKRKLETMARMSMLLHLSASTHFIDFASANACRSQCSLGGGEWYIVFISSFIHSFSLSILPRPTQCLSIMIIITITWIKRSSISTRCVCVCFERLSFHPLIRISFSRIFSRWGANVTRFKVDAGSVNREGHLKGETYVMKTRMKPRFTVYDATPCV